MMKQACVAICLWLGLAGAVAATTPADQVIRETSKEVTAELEANRAELEQNPKRLYQMVEEIVLPHFDFERMSRYVLGQHWRDASPEQQQQFVSEFKTLLVRTYATALFEYTGQEIEYKPFRHEEGDRQAVVQTVVQRADGPPIPIDYSLVQSDGEWKVYDVKIENLSLVTNYRAQYGRIVQSQGMSELIAQLSQKNDKLMNQ